MHCKGYWEVPLVVIKKIGGEAQGKVTGKKRGKCLKKSARDLNQVKCIEDEEDKMLVEEPSIKQR
ncbi:hypothetical protein H5410_044684 [Solanum commersonii]|uniref:Uncharacterized protein n=1 Tax=Solanum commersonii TaxID=4109 RepID=A0A9J5X8T6_SOLCO|nr:hypothetical protein H5410_044684 [Solanum commersonii]